MYQTYSEEERKAWLRKDKMHERLVIDGSGHEELGSNTSRNNYFQTTPQTGLYYVLPIYQRSPRNSRKKDVEQSLWSDEVKIDIKTPYKWFAIQPWGDFHVGAAGCDYDKLKELLAGPLEHDNLRTILFGQFGRLSSPDGWA